MVQHIKVYTAQSNVVQSMKIQYTTVQHMRVQVNTTQSNVVQYRIIQYITVQHIKVQWIQYSTRQYVQYVNCNALYWYSLVINMTTLAEKPIVELVYEWHPFPKYSAYVTESLSIMYMKSIYFTLTKLLKQWIRKRNIKTFSLMETDCKKK